MEILLILLVSALMGALNFGFFMLGYYIRSKKPNESAVVVDDNNRKAVEEIYKWMNYMGK